MSRKKEGVLLKLKKLDHELFLLLEELKKYNDVTLNRKPKPGAWSVLQVMHHLMVAEHYSLLYIRKKLSFDPELKKAGLLSSSRSVFLKLFLNSPFRIKAPDEGGESLPEESTFWEVAKQWKKQREELMAFLTSLDDSLYKKELFKHPYAGKMSINSMLDFFTQHFTRHKKQIFRTVEKSLDISKVLMQEEMKNMT